ncbi:MAG: hypothetical protein GWN58_34030 [Anaerolineae bacterium]|nr:hypothetical protein [Thermoplasmata archaeon]NIV34299.1 hypothetical protein [Anaerolineae bacterium]NIY06148.1 hypothetical protein [Thermoplasmata archaeon]
MAIPVATALIDGVHVKTYEYEALGSGLPITLTGSATEGPILNWEWSILATDPDIEGGIPEGSSLAVGVHGDFTNGKATVQNPTITLDAPGGYCFSLRAENAEGWSDPSLDKNGGYQAIVYIKTAWGVKQPPANQKRYQDDLNQGLQRLEDIAAGVTATGAIIPILDVGLAADSTTSPTFVPLSAAETAISFTAPAAGLYQFIFTIDNWSTSGISTARHRMVIDGGTSNEQVTPDTDVWDLRTDNLRAYKTFTHTFELSAGAHTFALQWKLLDGTGVQTSPPGAAQVVATCVTGSGVGGVVLDEAYVENASISGTHNNPPDAYTHVAGLDLNFTTNQDEQVMIVLSGSSYLGSSGYANTHTKIYVDGVMKRYAVTCYLQGQYDRGNTTLHYITEPLSAGPHLVEFKFAKWDTANSNWNLYYSWTTAIQYRGGLVPVESNGTVVTDKPRALNFIGAGVSVTDTDGTADIQLNEAITSAGDFIEVWTGQPATNIFLEAIDKQVMPEAGAADFVTKQTGEYEVGVELPFAITGGGGTTTIRGTVVFDEGEAFEQSIGNTDDWQARVVDGYGHPTFTSRVTLTAGSHTLKVYAREVAGTGAQITEAVTPTAPIKVVLKAVTGSGVAGTLVSEAEMSASHTITATYPTFEDIPSLSVTVDTAANERVLLSTTLTLEQNALGTTWIQWDIDGTPYGTRVSGAGDTTWSQNLSHSILSPELSAGSHTIKLQVAENANSFLWPGKIQVTRFRGGLVPVRKDGQVVLDKPAAWDFVGPNVQVTNVGGTAQVNFNGISGADTQEFVLDAHFTTTSSSFVPVTDSAKSGTPDMAITLSTTQGERVFISGKFALALLSGSGDIQAVVGVGLDGADPTAPYTAMKGWTTGTASQTPYSLSYLSEPLDAGTHTFRVMLRNEDSQNTRMGGGAGDQQSFFQVTRFKGGYVQPENVPIADNVTGTTYEFVKQGGASATLRVRLSDHMIYEATAPLTVDLSSSGLLGLEASATLTDDTHYYNYAVPSGTAGVFSIVASPNDPDTGPTDYPIYRYLGAVTYRTTIGGVRKFHQEGNKFYFADFDEDWLNSLVYGTGTPSVNVWYTTAGGTVGIVNVRTALSNAIPAKVAGVGYFSAFMDEDSGDSGMYLNSGEVLFTMQDNFQVGDRFIHAQGGTDMARGWVPLHNEDFAFGWETGSGGIDFGIAILGYEDSYLHGAFSSTQAEAPTQADTKLPELSWVSTSQISVAAAPGEPSTVRQTLQDGKQRYALSSLLFDFANGVADLGLDEGTEQASTWYYMYLVPTAGLDDLLTIRASDNPPDTGPTGYSNYKYVGAFLNTSTSDILKFFQSGARFDRAGDVAIQSETDPASEASPVLVSVAAYVPESASHISMYMKGYNTPGYVYVRWWIDGETSGNPFKRCWISEQDENFDIGMMPVPTTPKQFYQQREDYSGANLQYWWLATNGWLDAYLVGDRGGGGGLAAGTSGGGGGTTVDATEVVTPAGGGVTTLSLTTTPAATNTIKLWQDGVLMRRVTGTPSGLNEWYYNSSLNQAEFNDTLSSTWYYLEWEK